MTYAGTRRLSTVRAATLEARGKRVTRARDQPLRGGGLTRRIRQAELTEERLGRLSVQVSTSRRFARVSPT